jgi:hypothetical protein
MALCSCAAIMRRIVKLLARRGGGGGTQVSNVTQWNNSTTFPWPSGAAPVSGNFGNVRCRALRMPPRARMPLLTSFPLSLSVCACLFGCAQQFPPAQFSGSGRRTPGSTLPDAPVWSSNHGRAIVFRDTGIIDTINGVDVNRYVCGCVYIYVCVCAYVCVDAAAFVRVCARACRFSAPRQ